MSDPPVLTDDECSALWWKNVSGRWNIDTEEKADSLRRVMRAAYDRGLSDQRKGDAEEARDHVCQAECHDADEARDGCGEVIAAAIEKAGKP